MTKDFQLSDVIFVENGQIDANELNAFYRLIGGDSKSRRTEAETEDI